jgi:hypothetical protein
MHRVFSNTIANCKIWNNFSEDVLFIILNHAHDVSSKSRKFLFGEINLFRMKKKLFREINLIYIKKVLNATKALKLELKQRIILDNPCISVFIPHLYHDIQQKLDYIKMGPRVHMRFVLENSDF